jgi:aryl-alcohol dehydrogenase-like predicted oxidoreductase
LTVTAPAFGTSRFGRETEKGEVEIDRKRAHTLLDAYAEKGGRFIDTANVYGGGRSEAWLGDWLADRDRRDYVVASKLYWPTREDQVRATDFQHPNSQGLNRKHLRHQIEEILDRLQTEYVDILYIHRWDAETPVREFLRTLTTFVDEGLVHYLGASALRPDAWKVARANEIARRHGLVPFSVMQPRYNLVNREAEGEYLDMSTELDLGVVTWSPLAKGFLTGKYTREETEATDSRASDYDRWRRHFLTPENFDVLDEVRAVAQEQDTTPTKVALAWVYNHPRVTTPIVGARTVQQLEENVEARSTSLSDSQFEHLAAAKPGPYDGL